MSWLGDVVDTAKSVVDNDYVRAATAAVAPVLSLNLETGRVAAQHPELVSTMVVPGLIAHGVFGRTVVDPEYALGFWAELKGSAITFADYTHSVTRNQWVQVGAAGTALVYPPAGVPLCVGLAAADALAMAVKTGDASATAKVAATVDLAAGGNTDAERAAEMILSAEAAIDQGTTLVDQFWASAPEGVERPSLAAYRGGAAHQDLDLGPVNVPAPVKTGPSAAALAATQKASAEAASKSASAARAAEGAWLAEQAAAQQKALADATAKMMQDRQREADVRFAEDVLAMSGNVTLASEMLNVEQVRQIIASAQALGSALPIVTFRVLTNGRIEQLA